MDLLESLAMTTSPSEAVLVPANTQVSAKGDGAAVDVSAVGNRVFLVTLAITKIIEQESIDVSIYGSADGAAWEPKSLAAFRQEFYTGEYPLLLDLTAHPSVKFVRAHWEMARWGRGTEIPMFEFGVTMKEVPAEILREATAEAKHIAMA
jgi:pyridoxine 5'-phosphate synthase PdxJ